MSLAGIVLLERSVSPNFRDSAPPTHFFIGRTGPSPARAVPAHKSKIIGWNVLIPMIEGRPLLAGGFKRGSEPCFGWKRPGKREKENRRAESV